MMEKTMSSYYEEKSLAGVCGQGKTGLKPKTIFDVTENESEIVKKKIRNKAELTLAQNMPGPRDLDGRVGEINVKL